jgi:acylglycerol lipase
MVLDTDPTGHFSRSSFTTAKGCELATYTWLPDCGIASAKGCVFLLHGLTGHALFDFLDPNDRNERTEYTGSVPSHFNGLGLVVFAIDLPGHGSSSGMRLHWDRLDDLRQAFAECFESTLNGETYKSLYAKPRFVMGISMGGTLAIQISRLSPDLFTGYILLSPAVRPPDNMFGLYGRTLSAFGSILDALVPRLRVLTIPLNEDPVIRDAVMKDELVEKQPITVRVAREFQKAYIDIDANAASLSFPALLVIVGLKDPLVSPSGMQDFIAKVNSADKKVIVFDELGHEVFRERGCETARSAAYEWVSNRL